MFEFSEDMLPRHFPKVHLPNTKHETSVVTNIPQPTLPSVSLIFSNDANVKSQQSLRKGKEDHQRSKCMKKQVRFAVNTERQKGISGDNESFCIPSNLELSFFESLRESQLQKPCERPKYECVNRSPSIQNNFEKYGQGQQEKVSRSPSMLGLTKLHGNMREQNCFGFGAHGQQRTKSQSCAEVLINILEEQQRHIAIQQNQIMMQEKQSLEQQKQICILECQLEKLLLQCEADDIQSLHSAELDKVNVLKAENIFQESMASGVGSKRFIEKTIQNLSGNEGHNEYVCDRTVTADSAIYGYEFDGSASTMSHIKFTAQTSICETSANFVGNNHTEIAGDRSLVLNMLGIKYKCSEGKGSLGNDGQCWYYKHPSVTGQNEYPENDIPSEMHEYLVRHGLIKR